MEALHEPDFLTAVRSLYARALAESTSSERAQRALRILNVLDQSVVIVDVDLVVEWANERARAAFGVEPRVPLADPWTEVSLRELASLTLATGEPARASIGLKDGTRFELKTVPLGDSVALLLVDMTEQERALEESQRQVTALGHELSRALTGIAGGVEALRLSVIGPESDRSWFLEELGHATNRAIRLVAVLLGPDSTASETGVVPLQPLRLAPLLRHVADDLDLRPGAHAVVECSEELTALAERTLLTTALTSLGDAAGRAVTRGSIVFIARPLGRGSVGIEVVFEGPAVSRDRDRGAGTGMDSALVLAKHVASRLDAELEVERYAERNQKIRLVLRSLSETTLPNR